MAIRMKMKQKKIRKIGIASALGLVVLVMLGLYGARTICSIIRSTIRRRRE